MSPSLFAALALLAGTSAVTPARIVVEVGLAAPIERLESIDVFSRELAERLVWRIADDGSPETLRLYPLTVQFTAVRVERGRVTASYRSEPGVARVGLRSVAETIGLEQFIAFPDVCFTPIDPPMRVRAVSGTALLDAEGLERLVAGIARTGRVDGILGLREPIELDWGRHVILVLAASTRYDDAVVRPLLFVLERL